MLLRADAAIDHPGGILAARQGELVVTCERPCLGRSSKSKASPWCRDAGPQRGAVAASYDPALELPRFERPDTFDGELGGGRQVGVPAIVARRDIAYAERHVSGT